MGQGAGILAAVRQPNGQIFPVNGTDVLADNFRGTFNDFEAVCPMAPHLQRILTQLSTKAGSMKQVIENINGKVGVPILLWFLGVPGGVVILLWLFFFRG